MAITPRLLAEAVARLLEARGVDVTVYLEDRVAAGGPVAASFDIAIVSAALPEGLVADVVIRLPDTPTGAGIGSVRVGDVERPVDIADASTLVDLVNRLSHGRNQPRSAL